MPKAHGHRGHQEMKKPGLRRVIGSSHRFDVELVSVSKPLVCQGCRSKNAGNVLKVRGHDLSLGCCDSSACKHKVRKMLNDRLGAKLAEERQLAHGILPGVSPGEAVMAFG